MKKLLLLSILSILTLVAFSKDFKNVKPIKKNITNIIQVKIKKVAPLISDILKNKKVINLKTSEFCSAYGTAFAESWQFDCGDGTSVTLITSGIIWQVQCWESGIYFWFGTDVETCPVGNDC